MKTTHSLPNTSWAINFSKKVILWHIAIVVINLVCLPDSLEMEEQSRWVMFTQIMIIPQAMVKSWIFSWKAQVLLHFREVPMEELYSDHL